MNGESMTIPGWYPEEILHAGDEHLDPEYVETYDAKAQTDPADDLALLRARGLNETSTLVDLGAGTGTLALAAALICGRVIAVDVSQPMLMRLARRAAQLGIGNIEPVQAGFLSYQHQGPPADVVYSRNALHHLPDFWKAIALSRVAAFLKPGGVLRLRDLVYNFEPHEAGDFFEPWLANAPATPDRGWTRAELETHIRTEYSTFTWLLEPMLERAGFSIEERDTSARLYAAYTCVRR
jgi:ubiquinone/menaquinone biosynthesis C-methylase UbiE